VTDPTAEDQLGPIDFLAVEFPDGKPTTAGFDLLLDLAERDVIRILDVEFVGAGARLVAAEELDPGLSEWAGASSGLLDDDDLAEIGAGLAPEAVAAVIVFENRWVTGLVNAWSAGGARLIAEGGIPAADLLAALDATEPKE
jgi:Family of unknown function (DUF6325)